MNNILDITNVKTCFLTANGAEPIPPLGTILGNLGVNTIKFCEEFNIFSKSLPTYFILKTIIYIFENRSFEFKTFFPSTSFILNLLKFEKTIKVILFGRINDQVIICIKLKDILQLALFKFPKYDLKNSVPLVLGTVKSMNLIIEIQ
jgi:large subunit ribosomal protein L11